MANFSIKKRLKSFVYAFNGIFLLIKNEHNFRIHLTAAVLVIFTGYLFKINRTDWLCIAFAIGLVFMAEAFNSALEWLSDAISLSENDKIKKAKDIAAGAVLIAALTAATIGMIVFIPYFRLLI